MAVSFLAEAVDMKIATEKKNKNSHREHRGHREKNGFPPSRE
jgi:hypothetical protein